MPRRSRTIREIEVKLRVRDLAAVLRGLRRLGASEQGRVFEQNTLYDTPESDLRFRRRLLRLRVETPAPTKLIAGGPKRTILTSKAPLPGLNRSRYKEKLETEIEVESLPRLRSALRAVGLRPSFRYEKYRITFRLPQLHLDLDETPMGVFLELEGPRAAIDRGARALGFAAAEYIRATYWDLYAADCRRRGRKPTHMVFRRTNSGK